MKTISLLAFMAFFTFGAFAQKRTQETSFTVYGNCGMCANRIETALDIRGVKYAKWDKTKQELFVAYKSDKIELDSIHVAINKVGHDTDKSKADTAIYSKLPMCCAFRENHKVH